MREVELDALMARLSNGDRSAFEPLYAALRPRALRLAQARLASSASAGAAATAEDVTQAALMKVFANASEFEPGRPCLPWFYAVVANEIRSARRRQKSTANLGDEELEVEQAIDALPDAETVLIQREMERALELAVDALDIDSANAIRALLGRGPLPAVPPATFRKRVSRAYAKLRVILGAGVGR